MKSRGNGSSQKRPSTGVHSICAEGELREEDEAKLHYRLQSSARSYCHGVQPIGNLILGSASHNCRNTGLGDLHILPDELLVDLFGFLGPLDLARLSLVSKSFYIFCSHEPLWRHLVLENLNGQFSFKGSWKSTYVSSVCPSISISNTESGIKVRDFYSDYLFQSWLCASLEVKREWLERDNIERRRGISVEEFVLDFEEPNKPVLLEGCLENWSAMKKWGREYLIKTCGDIGFSVGLVDMKLTDYFQYADLSKEERPLYLFDSKFVEKVPQLGLDFHVPNYFQEDLFSVLLSERPDFRWIIIGPGGSGSSFHVDPNSTSAWNAVVRGSKKWVMFPPDTVPPGVCPSPDGAQVASPVSLMEWFMNFYQATKAWKKKPVECVCRAGEVVFVPHGWWHLVLNLEESVAITQNYVSRRNLIDVLDFLKRPNARELVSGTKDRENLYNKFIASFESAFPGTIKDLSIKDEARKIQQKNLTFWEMVADVNVGKFKFSF